MTVHPSAYALFPFRQTRREWLRRAAIAVCAAAITPELATPILLADEPRIPPRPRGGLTDAEEIALGKRFAAELEREMPLLANPLIDQHLNQILQQLAAQSRRPGLPYQVKVVNAVEVNSSSLPGGSIYVNRGMLDLLTTEDELAAVLAHEVAHIASRHAIQQLTLTFEAQEVLKQVLKNLNKQNGEVEAIILQLGGAVALLAKLHFSRQDEMEADLLGLYNMMRAGWDPRGYVKLFTAMEDAEQTDPKTMPLLSGHPPTAERLAAVQSELTYIVIPEDARTDSFDFRACKAALKLLPPPPRTAPPAE